MIPMQLNLPEISYEVPLQPDLQAVFDASALPPFSEEVLSFLADLSVNLLQDAEAKQYPDVISFAFWCRPAALHAMKQRQAARSLSLGRGIIFHIAPSNVPLNFAYSLAAGLLAGNANIVRIPSRDFPQVKIVCAALRRLIANERCQLRSHVVLVRYEKSDRVTDFFSAHCDVRVIWGGDQTIADVRRSPLSARSFDIAFADRYSFCAINADAYLSEKDHARVAVDFYNDTYLFDQNACTAPHLVVWVGSTECVHLAQELFWKNFHRVVAEKYQLQPVSAVNKLVDAYRFAASSQECHLQDMADNLIVRIQLEQLQPGLEDVHSTCGYFYECYLRSLNDIAPLVNRKFQTLAYYGFEGQELEHFVKKNRLKGIDRIVPIGRTLDFSLVWDGYDLISMLSRAVQID